MGKIANSVMKIVLFPELHPGKGLVYQGIEIRTGLTGRYVPTLHDDTRAELHALLFPNAYPPYDTTITRCFTRDERQVRELAVHTCGVCKKYFIAHWRTSVCSDACHREVLSGRNKANTMKRSERRARWRNKTCEVCFQPMESIRNHKYCSSRCRQKAFRVNHKNQNPPPKP